VGREERKNEKMSRESWQYSCRDYPEFDAMFWIHIFARFVLDDESVFVLVLLGVR